MRLSQFTQFHILDFNQYGFRTEHSTAMAIYDIIKTKLTNKDKGMYAGAVYLDLSKVFDTVNHKILVRKLNRCGIRGLSLKLIKTYLSHRKQYVYITGTASDLLSINMGVSQGSTLGPLLFLISINDLQVVSPLTATKL